MTTGELQATPALLHTHLLVLQVDLQLHRALTAVAELQDGLHGGKLQVQTT